MIIRVQSTSGMKRIEVSEVARFSDFVGKVSEEFKLDSDGWFLTYARDGNDRLNHPDSKTLKSANFKHGDLFFLKGIDTRSEKQKSNTAVQSSYKIKRVLGIPEDEIDEILHKMDGKIKRKRNEYYCRHPESGQCIHCSPIEPSDPLYLEQFDPPVKFLPFHAYLKKMQANKSSYLVNLEDFDCSVKKGCADHPPWPEGICTKCQPKPMTLNRQTYRHLDFVQFENPDIVDNFLDYWRKSGNQRIGILMGKYSLLDTIGSSPLAIKCVITSIYEPFQESTKKSVKFSSPLEEILSKPVTDLNDLLGLQPVGWIFTDLVACNSGGEGIVKHFRGTIDTFFLSAQECITSACLQNLYPNACRLNSQGIFGSKFVTVVITGDAQNQIHFEAYQVTNQAMALCRDKIIVPTYDAPELGYVRTTTKEQFVPEVFYSCNDEYGNQVTKVARPLPIEYLLVDIPVAFPKTPLHSFAQLPGSFSTSDRQLNCFPIENRDLLGVSQDFSAFSRYLNILENHVPRCDLPYHTLCNYHVLLWLMQSDVLMPLLQENEEKESLILAIKQSMQSKSPEALAQWAESSSLWATAIEMVNSISERAGAGSSSNMDDSINAVDSEQTWSCAHCTFHNDKNESNCSMCGLPR